MKRFALCLVLALWCNSAVQAVTIKPGGELTSDEVWILAASPYQLTGDLTIPDKRTLTIQPGVTVYLGSGVSITVADGGRILAEGTAAQGIRFTSPPGSNASWGGITINGAAGSPGDAHGLRVLRGQRQHLHPGDRWHAVP